MSDIKCYFDFNEHCYRDVPKDVGEWRWDGVSYKPVEGRNLVIYPNVHCVRDFPGYGDIDGYQRLKQLGFNILYFTPDYSKNERGEITEISNINAAKASGAYSNNEIILALPREVANNVDDIGSLIKLTLGSTGGDLFAVYLDEPISKLDLDEDQLRQLADTVHTYGQKLILGEYINEITMTIPVIGDISIGPDKFNNDGMEYADYYAYTRYVKDIFSGDQTNDWRKWRSRYPNKALFPWIKMDYLEGGNHLDIQNVEYYLRTARQLFSNAGLYALEIVEDVFTDMNEICSRCSDVRIRNRKACAEQVEKMRMDQEVRDFIFGNFSNFDLFYYCICMDYKFKPSEYYSLLSRRKRGYRECSELVDIACQVYWKRLEAFRDAAIKTGWLMKNEVWHHLRTEYHRYYCQFGDCAKCNNKLLTDKIGDKNYWGKNPLPMCSKKGANDKDIVQRDEFFIRSKQRNFF